MELLNYLRELNVASVLVRLLLAMFMGGLVGVERGRKRRAAGFRTYMLVCMGAALTMLLGQYQAVRFGFGSDVTRYGAQVINGIGFLGAGTIVLTGRKEVRQAILTKVIVNSPLQNLRPLPDAHLPLPDASTS